MLRIIDPEELGIPEIKLSSDFLNNCRRCAAYQPSPEADGNLQVDPEINLPSIGMDVNIAYYYNSKSSYNGPFGYGRTISANQLVQASGSPVVVSFSRGNGNVDIYEANTSGTYVAQTTGLLNTLVADTTDNLWKETTPDGITSVYPLNTTGMVTSISYVQDAVGNIHTYSYSSGRLTNIEDAVGRLVTFAYNSSDLLSNIEDWAGRITTFAYDTTSVAGQPALTTITGPTGCQTLYEYNSSSQLTQITDPNGYSTTYAYDSNNRVTLRHALGVGVTTYTYSGSAQQVVNALGHITTQVRNARGALVGIVNAAGNQTTLTRNYAGQATSSTNALGATSQSVYDSSGNLISSIDALSRATTYTRDSYNNIVSTTSPDGTQTQQIFGYSGSSYDTTGAKRRVQASIDSAGCRTTYAYNSRGECDDLYL